MPFARALRLAEKIEGELLPFCERTAIAGSIRRRRPDCGDIDLVLVVKPGKLHDLKARVLVNATLVKDGPQEMVCTLRDGTQLDLWFAHAGVPDLLDPKPSNFGSMLLCRTGSVSHNIYLVEHAKRLGLRWNPHHGVFDQDNRCLASASEEGVFAALKLEFVPPGLRER